MHPQTATPAPAPAPGATCAELLLAYQGTVVHDLRGELNGLLLTIDFIRRQLGTRPDVASMFGESLGDLDGMRGSLTRTLNQLDAVGHVRRVVGGREQQHVAELNVAQVVGEVAHALGDRARRRGVHINPPPRNDVLVRLDPVVVQLAVHRLLFALVESLKKTDLRLEVEPVRDGQVTVVAVVSDAAQVPPDFLDKPLSPGTHGSQPQPLPVAVGLSVKLADLLGGRLTREAGPDASAVLRLRLPTEPPGV